MKIHCDTVEYYVKDAADELKKILRCCKNMTLQEGVLLPMMEHAIEMLNCAFNSRFLSREKISKMSQDEWEKYLTPPKEIFRMKEE